MVLVQLLYLHLKILIQIVLYDLVQITTGGNVYINQTAAATNGSGRLQLTGTAAITGNTPSILCSITADNYPLFNLMPYNHNDIELLFDCWRMPSFQWYSSSATANWRLAKTSGAFALSYATGVTEGNQITSFNNGWSVTNIGQFRIGTVPSPFNKVGAYKLYIGGTNNSADGPHIATYTNDNYPLLQAASLAHNNILLGFDTYHDATTYRSSDSGSNFVLGKISNSFQVLVGSGTAAGTIPTMTVASSWNSSGQFYMQLSYVMVLHYH